MVRHILRALPVLLFVATAAHAQTPGPSSDPAPDATTPPGTPPTTTPSPPPDVPVPPPAAATVPPEPTAPPSPPPVAAPVAPPSKPKSPPVSVTGYLQAVYENQTDTNDDGAVPPDSFSLKRIRVRLKSDINAWLGFTIMFEVAGAQSPLRDGFLSFKLPHHELKVGQQKTQFGYENPLSSTKLFTVNRALVSDTLGRGSDLRDIGLGVFGTWKLPPDFEAGYAVTFVNGAGANRKEDTELKNVWGRAGVTYAPHDLGITSALGVSFARGDQLDPGSLPMDPADDFDARFHRLGVDMELEAKWVFAAFEYIRGTTDTGGGAEADSQGWYVLAAGKTPWHVGPVLKIDQLDPNMDAADDSRLRYTFGAYADIGKAFRVLGNYELDRSDKRKDDTMLLFVQLVY